LEAIKLWILRWLTSIPFFILLGLILGILIAISVIPKPEIAIIPISGAIFEQTHTDSIINELKAASDNNSIKAVVLQINSPGGAASAIEPIYLEVLRLRQQKPVVTYIGTVGASGGYYIAVASNFIYAVPSSSVGSIGVITTLPTPESLDENTLTSGPFKASGGSARKTLGEVATLKQQFIGAVSSQRGDRLSLTEDELSRAEVYSGTESLKYGLIDDIGTSTDAIQKAAHLAHLRNYQVVEHTIQYPESAIVIVLESPTNTVPIHYYLYVEME
jgi:protease-4